MQLSNRVEKEFLPFVNKPGCYTGNEYNVVLKDPAKLKLRAALAFPEVYELGMSHPGYDILYHILNSQEHIWAERVYMLRPDAEELLKSTRIPLFTLESKTALPELDWIGFTLQHELTYTNILAMLDLAGIPLRSADRDERWPFIIGGGPCAGNPEPVAPFFDAFLIGDGEEAVLDICELLIRAREEKWGKDATLLQMARIPGLYIPSLYQVTYNHFGELEKIEPLKKGVPGRIPRRVLPELNKQSYPMKPLVPLTEMTHDRLPEEIMRRCREGCRFCGAGMIYRPVRQKPVEDILAQTEKTVRSSGAHEVSLLSLNGSDYDDLNWLMLKEKILLSGDRVSFAFPSLRLDSVTPEMVDFVRSIHKSGFTFAPEAGSQRLRNVINKNIREQDLLDTLRLVLEKGWKQIKFYFMIGLPTEKESDLHAISELMERCLEIAANFKDVVFHISLSPFSPKPHTPFQWEKQELPPELNNKIRFLQDRLRHKQLQLSWRDGYNVALETVFSRGGRELAGVLEEAWRNGARQDGWEDYFDWQKWEDSFHTLGMDWKRYLRPLSVSIPLPWNHIDLGISDSFLQLEKKRAYQGELSPDCGDHVCLGCGLPRKAFEDLVKCCRQPAHRESGPMKPIDNTAAHRRDSRQNTGITYGRSRKKRTVTTAPARKKIRIQYSKTGVMRFFSHLDIVRLFDQAARRAKISLVYTRGSNPHPKISYGPPLGLGIASIAEYLDLEAEIGSEADFQIKLNKVLPQGIEILTQQTIFSKAPALAAVINRWTYETFLENFGLPGEWIENWMKNEEIRVERDITNGTKNINIRPFVKDISINHQKLVMTIDSIDGRTAKVTEVLETLMREHGVDYRNFLTQRTAQYIVRGEKILDPFQVL